MKAFDLLYVVPTDKIEVCSDGKHHMMADIYGRNYGNKIAEHIIIADCIQSFPISIQCNFDYNISINKPCIRFWCKDHKLAFDNNTIRIV